MIKSPNWCHNKLTVTGDPETITEFVDAVKTEEQPLSFEKIAPRDAGDDWYEWSLKNWGTKWDASFGSVFCAFGSPDAVIPDKRVSIIQPGSAFYAFETAWSPPLPVIETASKIWPGLRFELSYGEPGNDYAGKFVCDEGVVICDEDLPIDEILAPEEMWF